MTTRIVLILAGLLALLAISAFWFLYIQGLRPLQSWRPLTTRQESSRSGDSPGQEVELQLTEVVRGLVVPWSIVFTDSQRMLVTERAGRVRVITSGQLQSEPIHAFSDVSSTGEEGLMGMTLDPEYERNRFIYFSMAYDQGDQLYDRVVRLTDTGTALTEEKLLIDGIPAARNHAGSRIRFGPDGKLYITTGDATERQLAQDTNSLAGKILRLNADGTIPDDNPVPGSPIYSLGHRNPQGLDWHPVTQTLYSTEHGPSGNDGPGGGDEVNVIVPKGNYGWPVVSHTQNKPGFIAPIQVYTPAVAPASGMFYRGTLIPQFTNHFLFGGLRGEGLYLVRVNQDDPTKTDGYEKIEAVEVGRIRDVVEGPDGALYLTTSNRDGRGRAADGDDKIYRLAPGN